MPLALRALAAALALLFAAAPASARITDPEMTCAEYLKTGSRKAKSDGSPRESAAVEARIRAFCAANPRMKAIDAEMTMTGD